MSSTQQLLLGEGAGGSGPANYIEDVFSTYLYTGNGNATSRTIQNNIDLSTKGGMVWIKSRTGVVDHDVTDTVRGARKPLFPNRTYAQDNNVDYAVNSFLTNGFTLASTDSLVNQNSQTYVSWAFREQPKFFDIVTYTGNGTNNRQIAHNLGSVPGCIMVKRTNASSDWYVYHRGLNGGTNPQNYYILLNSTAAQGTYEVWENTAPTSTVFTVDEFSSVNGSGDTFVAYLFAHNAGGFGAAGTDNVITCGSYTGNGSDTNGTNVDLGWEPQFILVKRATGGTSEWFMVDNVRGFTADGIDQRLNANLTGAEDSTTAFILKSTGFQLKATGNPNTSGSTYIYIAIRRGPMKIPTSGTSVFMPVATTANGATSITANFPVDLSIIKARANVYNWWWSDRLRGNQYAAYLGTSRFLFSNTTDSEQIYTDTTPGVMMASNTGIIDYAVLPSGYTGIYYNFQRAPSVFDVVCYAGTGSPNNVTHNLQKIPELIIVKERNGVSRWWTLAANLSIPNILSLNTNNAVKTGSEFGSTQTITSTAFSVAPTNGWDTNDSGATYVAYLFASCPGVSKVGSYVGNGVDTTIDCGFVDGARLVLIKSTSYAENWAIFDSARGYATASDPYLALDSSGAESLGNWLLFRSEGFGVRSSSFPGGSLNVSGQSYIFLAIA